MFTFELRGYRELIGRLEGEARTIGARTRKGLRDAGQIVLRQAQENANGAVLNRRSGRLYSALKTVQEEMAGNSISQLVGLSLAEVPYGAIHEYGGVIHHPGSEKFQVFEADGTMVFTHGTRPHDIPIPERSYLRSALMEQAVPAFEALRDAIYYGRPSSTPGMTSSTPGVTNV
jgi:phage gpG-like protein